MSIDTLNALFKDVSDLDKLPQASEYTQLATSYIQNTLAARSQAPAPSSTVEEIAALKHSTQLLREKTQSTRGEVQAMTSDIKRLDATKQNLVASVTMLKRLQMLTKLHSQLDPLLRERQYRQIAPILAAATELSDYFRDFRSLPHVAHLSQLVAEQRLRIQQQATQDVHAFVEGADRTLSDLDWASRAAGSRTELTEWYTHRTLKPYTEIFAPGSEAAGIENIDRRYGMLRNILNKHLTEIDKVFPTEWAVGLELAISACETTRNDISRVHFGSGQDSVQALLDALHQTTEFEAYLRRRFDNDERFQSPISRAFTPHLNVWVDFHQRTLGDKLQVYQSHTWNEEPEGSDVFASSADLFLYYRSAMEQMSKLTTGQPFANLATVFSRFLVRYAGLLQSYLGPNQASGPGAAGAAGAAGATPIEITGKILKTADYCISTISQLEATISSQVSPEFADQISFEDATDRFMSIIRICLDALVDQVEYALRSPWREMANVNWSRLEQTGDQSGYVNQLCLVLKRSTDTIGEVLSKQSHRRIICDNIVGHVTSQFLTTVFTRVKPVSEVAAEQLLLDFYTIKATLLELGPDEKYRDHTARVATRVENILKVLLTQQEPAEGFIRNYLLLTTDASVPNFRKVLEAKGIRLQNKFIEQFKAMAEGQQESDLSPLTHISMVRQIPTAPKSPPPEPISKFSENFKRIGGFLRRDTPNGSPLLR